MPNETVEQETNLVSLTEEINTPEPRKGYEYYANLAAEADAGQAEDTSPDTNEGSDNVSTTQDTIPEKFKGKSLEEVIASYTELESQFGKRNNEVGSLRKLNDKLLELNTETPQSPAEAPKKEIGVDTLLDNPSDVINEAIETNPRLKSIEDALVTDARNKAKAAFESNHKEWESTLADPSFQAFVMESSYRQRQFADAHTKYDYAAADDLFSTYDQVKGNAIKEATTERNERAKTSVKKAVTETKSVNTADTPKDAFKRSELIELKLHNPAKYNALKDRIMAAYASGSVINDL